MLSVNYGNFLRKSETAKAVYEFKRPVYQFIANTVCVFCLAGAVTSGLALSYAYMATPKPVYSQELYGKAQSLNNNLSRGAALMKQGRPRGVNAYEIINKFANARPADVTLTDIVISPEQYTVKGFTPNQDSVNAYISALDFGKGKKAGVASISNNKGMNEFTIIVHVDEQKAAAKSSPQPKGSGK